MRPRLFKKKYLWPSSLHRLESFSGDFKAEKYSIISNTVINKHYVNFILIFIFLRFSTFLWSFKWCTEPGRVAHAFNPDAQEVEEGESL